MPVSSLKLKAGFTLIELLTVMAIIGLIMSIGIANLKDVRNKGKNMAILTDFREVRMQAMLIFSERGTYRNTVCAADNTLNDADYPDTLGLLEANIRKYNGNIDPTCYGTNKNYCLVSPLIGRGYYCIDSYGYVNQITDPNNCQTNIKCVP